MPISIVFFFLIFGLVTKKKKRKKKFLIVGIVLLYIFCNNAIVSTAVNVWEKPVIPLEDLEKDYEVGVILTGVANTTKKPQDRVYLGQSADRAIQPVMLYKKGFIKKILISGGSGSLFPGEVNESEVLKELLIICGIPKKDIYVETESRNTYENAVNSAEVIKSTFKADSKILLITSAFHMRRSLGCFEAAGISCDPFPVDFRGDINYTFDNLFVPKEEALHKSYVLIHEVVGYMVYAIVGYL